MRSRRKMGIASKRGQMKYVRLLLWGMYEEMVHSFFKVGQCPQGHNWSTYFATYHCTLVFPKYIYKIIFKTFIHLKHCQCLLPPARSASFPPNVFPSFASMKRRSSWSLVFQGNSILSIRSAQADINKKSW